jgi:signal peptidase
MFKILYNIFLAFLAVIALLLIVSSFPITGNFRVLVVKSGSMQPALKTGSIVVIKPAQQYKVGDIITYQYEPDLLITHRIYQIKKEKGQTAYIVKGDANNAPDPDEVNPKKVLGKVWFSLPYLGYAVDEAKKPIGFIFIIVIPAAIIIFDEVKKIIEEIKRMKMRKGPNDIRY